MRSDGMVLKKTLNVISTVLVVIVIALAVLLAGVRIFGFKPFAVLSGSMTPKYPVGSLVYVHSAKPSEIKVGDAITFVAGTDRAVVTHRVIKVDTAEGCFRTKGDANENADAAPVYFENLVGRVRFSLPYLGYLSTFLSTAMGKIVAIAFLALLFLLFFVPDLFKKSNEKPKE